MPHRHWFIANKNNAGDPVDTKGVAVALAFLAAMTVFAGGRGDKTADPTRGPQPGQSAHIERRPAASFAEQTAVSAQSVAEPMRDRGNPKRDTSTR